MLAINSNVLVSPHSWYHVCLGLDTDSGLLQMVMNGHVLVNEEKEFFRDTNLKWTIQPVLCLTHDWMEQSPSCHLIVHIVRVDHQHHQHHLHHQQNHLQLLVQVKCHSMKRGK